jgi:hypothetical protein
MNILIKIYNKFEELEEELLRFVYTWYISGISEKLIIYNIYCYKYTKKWHQKSKRLYKKSEK